MSARNGARALLTLLAFTVAAPAVADAQIYVAARAPKRGTAELGLGGAWSGGQNLEPAPASLTPNTGSSFDLFTSDPSLTPAFGATATVAVYLTRALAIEGGFQYARPRVEVRLSDDFENAPELVAETPLSQYLFTGSLVYHFAGSGRLVPFIAGGGGHVRDVHSGNGLVETGTEYHGKFGVKSWFGRRRSVGFRAEGGLSLRDGGFTFEEEGARVVPMAGLSLAFLF